MNIKVIKARKDDDYTAFGIEPKYAFDAFKRQFHSNIEGIEDIHCIGDITP